MTKGYQIIEVPELNGLVENPNNHQIAISILSWLIPRIRQTLARQLADIEIEVIPVKYQGSYPAIGLHYTKEMEYDAGPDLLKAASNLLRTVPIIDYITVVGSTDNSLAKLWKAWLDRAKE